MTQRILVVDDDEQLSEIICLELEGAGFEVHSSVESARTLSLLSQLEFSLVLLDLRLGEESGMDLLSKIRDLHPDLPVLMMTAHGDVDSVVQAFSLRVDGYIRKPFQEGDLKHRVCQAIEAYRPRLEARLQGAGDSLEVGQLLRTTDPSMEGLLRRIASAAQVTSNVVIIGESGTGKELVARALHQCGPRRQGPFVALNCAALPESLMESELFGHVRGSFTDAKESRPGLIARASGGVLFLDEIGDAPLSIQTKLLRALQEKEILPLGALKPVKIDIRIVAATHRSLLTEVENGRFRQDLFYRLHVIPIYIPPLRERPRDILYLATHFAAKISAEMGAAFSGFTTAAQIALMAHTWPGNVRELQNRVEHALALGEGNSLITSHGLFPEMPEHEAPRPQDRNLPTFGEAKESFERSYLERLLSVARGNIAKAARLASKSRTEVYNLLRKHRLDPRDFKTRF